MNPALGLLTGVAFGVVVGLVLFAVLIVLPYKVYSWLRGRS